jgi:hypothetical protein
MEGKERELSARIGIVQPFALLEFTVHRIRCLVLRAADRYVYTSCGSTAYCYILPEGRANTYRHRKILSVECLSRVNSWSLSSCAFPAGSRAAECTNLRRAT